MVMEDQLLDIAMQKRSSFGKKNTFHVNNLSYDRSPETSMRVDTSDGKKKLTFKGGLQSPLHGPHGFPSKKISWNDNFQHDLRGIHQEPGLHPHDNLQGDKFTLHPDKMASSADGEKHLDLKFGERKRTAAAEIISEEQKSEDER